MHMTINETNWHKIRCFFLLALFVCIYFLTERYFKATINADFVNSSLVWREIQTHGLQYTLMDWRPTPDSWYFSVYPFHFLLFWITGSDGPGVLIFATSCFSFCVAYSFFKVAEHFSLKLSACIIALAIAFMPEIMYTHGFIAHPFAHNSTSAWGSIALLLFIINIKKSNIYLSILSSLITFIAISSDMWLAPSYLIPIIITQTVICLNNKVGYRNLSFYVISFALGYLHVLPNIFGIENQSLSVVSINEMIFNAMMMVRLIGETLNIFIVQNSVAWYASFVIWLLLLTVIAIKSVKSRDDRSYTAIVLLLSVAGICSSYILINNLFKVSSVRYFVNIIPCVVGLAVICSSGRIRQLSYIMVTMLIFTSIVSYSSGKIDDHEKYNDLNKYISFLDSHNLTYGYGEFWHNGMEITWVSGGRITVVPAANNKDHGINAVYARPQTMRHWYDKGYQAKTPKRQFIAFSKGYVCPDKQECMDKVKNAYGKPDEILTYSYLTLFVYNNPIVFYR